MTEAELTTKHTGQLRKLHPNWVVLKHCDRFTSGIPDVSVSLGIKTVWVEYKLLKKRSQSLTDPNSWVDNLAQLEQTSRLDGHYLVYDPFQLKHLLIAAKDILMAKHRLVDMILPGHGFDQLENLLIGLL